jgi:two-component system phosphate regulon sensor histidine kinase PhoR
MKRRKDFLPMVLMTSSIVLLLLLQTLWLVSSYETARNDLHRQTTDLLRSSILEMRDSIFTKSFKKFSLDNLKKISVDKGEGHTMFFSFNIDTVKKGARIRRDRSRSEIIIARGETDSAGNQVVVRYMVDTLSRDSLFHHYAKALKKVDIDIPFTVRLQTDVRPEAPFTDDRMLPEFRGQMATEWSRFSPAIRYAAVFDHVPPYLYFKISPQILFSIALTLITSAAFLMMYRSMKSQQRLMEMKNDFISNITHELKTPVTTVSVALEALRNFKGLENPKTTREYLDIAQSELTRLTMLTDKVLKTAVFDNRGVNFESEPVDLHKTVDQILHSMKLIFEKQKAQVTFEQKGNSFTIRGGSVHLTNVIYNLLDNALKYSFENPQISIRLEENEKTVILKVSDKGIGIPSEYKKKIFEKFFRVPTGDIHNIKGYGLGLSYVDSVIRSHNGLIEVASKPGEGSMFTISLPKGM